MAGADAGRGDPWSTGAGTKSRGFDPCGGLADEGEGLGEQGPARLAAVPGRDAARVGQGDDLDVHAVEACLSARADDPDQRAPVTGHKLEGERAHREHERRLEDRNLSGEEGAAAGDLVAVGLAVAAAGGLAGESRAAAAM
jgi:hypothetical protein